MFLFYVLSFFKKGDTIQGGTLFKGGHYLRKYGKVKSLSENLIFASTNPQYDKRLFIELPAQYMKIPSSEHRENIGRT